MGYCDAPVGLLPWHPAPRAARWHSMGWGWSLPAAPGEHQEHPGACKPGQSCCWAAQGLLFLHVRTRGFNSPGYFPHLFPFKLISVFISIFIYFHIYFRSKNTLTIRGPIWADCLSVRPRPSPLSLLLADFLSRPTCVRAKWHFLEPRFFIVPSTTEVQNSPGRRNPCYWGLPSQHPRPSPALLSALASFPAFRREQNLTDKVLI